MAGDPLKYVARGPLRLPAATMNACIDAARALKSSQVGGAIVQQVGNRPMVLVQNSSGGALDRFRVLGIDGPVILPADNEDAFASRIAVSGIIPDIDLHVGKFAILAQPAAIGAIVPGWIAGEAIALIDMVDDNHGFADIADGQTILQSKSSGAAQIIWVAPAGGTSTDPRLAIVRIGSGPISFDAKITALAAIGSSDSKWVYTITQVDLTVTASGGTPSAVSYATTSAGIAGAKALNLAEWMNQDNTGIAFGVDRAGDDYPAGFAPRPISGGGADNTHRLDVPVHIFGSVIASDGTLFYLFDRQGSHDGTCAAGGS